LPTALAQPSAPTSAIHAPLSLVPFPFPRRLFRLAQRLQRIYNVLYARIAMDEDFLDEVMGAVQGVGKVDQFVGQLWTGWKQLRDEGLVQVCYISCLPIVGSCCTAMIRLKTHYFPARCPLLRMSSLSFRCADIDSSAPAFRLVSLRLSLARTWCACQRALVETG
jgi:hypothetical protein